MYYYYSESFSTIASGSSAWNLAGGAASIVSLFGSPSGLPTLSVGEQGFLSDMDICAVHVHDAHFNAFISSFNTLYTNVNTACGRPFATPAGYCGKGAFLPSGSPEEGPLALSLPSIPASVVSNVWTMEKCNLQHSVQAVPADPLWSRTQKKGLTLTATLRYLADPGFFHTFIYIDDGTYRLSF
jgi:hypothetical protein